MTQASPGVAAPEQWTGLYLARVARTRTQDSYVQLQVPQVLGSAVTNWAAPMGVWAGAPPAVGTVVLAAFTGGDINTPVWTSQVSEGNFPALETSASVFQPDGTASAGSTGKAADAGHVHPLPEYDTWHNMPSVSGVTATWARYRLKTSNGIQMVQVECDIYASASGSQIAIWTPSPGSPYQWKSEHRFAISTTNTTNPVTGIFGYATAGGSLNIVGVGSTSYRYMFIQDIPLD